MLRWISFFIQCCLHMSFDVFPQSLFEHRERFRARRLLKNFILYPWWTVHSLKDLGCVNPWNMYISYGKISRLSINSSRIPAIKCMSRYIHLPSLKLTASSHLNSWMVGDGSQASVGTDLDAAFLSLGLDSLGIRNRGWVGGVDGTKPPGILHAGLEAVGLDGLRW